MSLLKMKPAKPKVKLEKDLQRDFKEWAYKTFGRIDLKKGTGRLMIVKMSTLAMYGEVGWEDHLILIKMPGGPKTIFIEWKRDSSQECSAAQLLRQAEHRAMGYSTYVCSCMSDGQRALTQEVLGKPKAFMPGGFGT